MTRSMCSFDGMRDLMCRAALGDDACILYILCAVNVKTKMIAIGDIALQSDLSHPMRHS